MSLNAVTLTDLCRRLESVEGHVRGVRRMSEEGKGCDELLVQLAAIRGAVDRAAGLVLSAHLDQCLRSAIESGNKDAALAELRPVLRYLMP